MAYYFIDAGEVQTAAQPPASARQLGEDPTQLLPPLVTNLHEALRTWGEAGVSPGPITARSFWFQADGKIGFELVQPPQPLTHVGLAPDLAAWLVLLDKSMETFVVIARARIVWSVEELGGALGF
ncbi:MAG: hypothetical protein HC802_01065 [Caldilineaceae bacterium]|nr:hypothetical protein [Caldilineaceae bacterium]